MIPPIFKPFISASWTTLCRYGWIPILVFGVHEFCAHGIDGYERWPWVDIPLHFFGGVAIALFLSGGLKVLKERSILPSLPQWVQLGLIWGLVNTTALLWEFAEFLSDRFLGSSCQLSLEDTLMDLLLGMLGGLLVLLPLLVRATRGVFRSGETSV